MPTKEEKHHSSGGSSGTNSGNNGSNSSSGSGTEKHKYCLLCNRNEFTLKSFDPTIEKDLRAIYNIEIKFKENRKVCLQCLHSIKLLKRCSSKDEPMKKYGDCCKDLFENVTYFQELRNKYHRYVNRLIDSRNKDKDKESPKKTSDHTTSSTSSSNQSTPSTCSPVSSAPSTSPDVISTTPKSCIKQISLQQQKQLSHQQQQQQQQQQSSSQSQQPTKLNDKSPNKANTNGKSLKLVDMSHCKGIERLQNETVSVVKIKEKEKEKEKDKDKETVKNAAGGTGNSKKKTPPNHQSKKDVVVAQDGEKQKSPAKTIDGNLAKDKPIEEATKSIDGTTKSNKRRSQDRKLVEQEPKSGVVAESETKTKLSNSSNTIVNMASPVTENKTEVLIAAKTTKPTKLPTNTKKSRVQRSSSPKQHVAATQTPPTRQQRSCTFEQALSQAEPTRSKTRTQTQKRSVLTQTLSELEPLTESESVSLSVSKCEEPTIETLPEIKTPENELPENKVPQIKTSENPPKVRKTIIEKFEFTVIDGKKIEVPARAKLDPKMFQCFVKLSRKPYQKRKLNGLLDISLSLPKKRKRGNNYNKIESELQSEIAAIDESCNSQTPRSILQKIDCPRTPLTTRKKRVSFIGVPPASPPSDEKTETSENSLETANDTKPATESESVATEMPQTVETPIIVEEPKEAEAPEVVEPKEVEEPTTDEVLNQEISRPIKRSRAAKKQSNENSGKNNRKTVKDLPATVQMPPVTEKPSAPAPAPAPATKTATVPPEVAIESNIVVPIVEEIAEVVSLKPSAPEAQLISNSSEEVEFIPTETETEIETEAATEISTNKIIVEEIVDSISEEVSIISDTSGADAQLTTEPIKKKRKPYTRTKPTNATKDSITLPAKSKEKPVTKRQRKQGVRSRKTKHNLEATGDIEIVNPEEIKRNVLINDSIVESVSDNLKIVDETDEDEVKLLIEVDPLAIGTEDRMVNTPIATPISIPISIPISVPISTPISTPASTPVPEIAITVSTPISTPTHMPTQIPKSNLDATPETPKSMTSVQVERSHETPLKIKISNGKVVQSEFSPPQTSPSKDLNCVDSSPKAGARNRAKRIRKKKVTPDYVDNDVSVSESDEPVLCEPSTSNERKKRRTTSLSKRFKEKDVAVHLSPSTNVEEVTSETVDQTPISISIPMTPPPPPTPFMLPIQSVPAPVPQHILDDRVFRAYVLVDKMLQQIDTTNFNVLGSQSQPLTTLQSAYPQGGTQTQLVFRTEPIPPEISQATESLLQMNRMNENNGCVTHVIRNIMENDNEHETEPHSMNVIQNYTNDGMNNDGGTYEVQETTICENVGSPTMPIMQTDNTGAIIGFESPATVDSTTSGYSSATATSSVYLLDTQSLNHSIEMTNGFNASDFNMQHMQYETFPFVEIQTSDIIDILGKTNDCNDSLNMENINLDTTASTADTRTTYYLTDEHSINTINTINSINTVATMTQTLPTLTTGNILGVFRTKASLKQIDPPPTMHLFTDVNGHPLHTHPHSLAHAHAHTHTIHGHSSGIPNEISAKMLRTDNPILSVCNNEETSIEMQDATESFSMAVDSMVTSSDTVQSTQRRPGLNVVFSTPSKRNNVYLSNENVSIDEFISESHQSLLNPDNFPTTTTTEEPHLDFYTLGI